MGFLVGRMPFLLPDKKRHSTEGPYYTTDKIWLANDETWLYVAGGEEEERSITHTRTHARTHTHTLFNGHFPGKPGLAGCRLDSQSPVILIQSVLTGQSKNSSYLFWCRQVGITHRVLRTIPHQLTLITIPRVLCGSHPLVAPLFWCRFRDQEFLCLWCFLVSVYCR